ncbi:unnamed protein product, partial [Effrenium voratum]
ETALDPAHAYAPGWHACKWPRALQMHDAEDSEAEELDDDLTCSAKPQEADSSDAESDEDEDWTAEDDELWENETDRDYYSALELPRISLSSSRVRAAYHRVVQKWHPDAGYRQRGDRPPLDRRAVLRRFWLINEAYLVLTDPERRRIYDECGFKGFKQSESCYADPVFEKDAFQVYEDFFNGTDPEARDFLLMNGSGGSSESEDDAAEAIEADLPAKPTGDRSAAPEPDLPPSIAQALGIEKEKVPALDEQLRRMLNSALSSAPSAATSSAPQDEQDAQEIMPDSATQTDRVETESTTLTGGVGKDDQPAPEQQVRWKYWKGVDALRRRTCRSRNSEAIPVHHTSADRSTD